jgi:dolichol kinase
MQMQTRFFQMRELYRKLFHIGFGLAIAAMIYLTEQMTALTVLMVGTLCGLIFTDAILKGYRVPLISFLVDNFERKGELPGKGALFFAVSCLFCVTLFPKEIVFPAVVTFSLLDGLASLFGYYFGRHRVFNHKTVEGALGSMGVTLVVLLFIVPPLMAALAVSVAGVIELFSPIDDNLLIPPGVCFALSLSGMM